MIARRQKDESEMDKLKSKYQQSSNLQVQPSTSGPRTPGMLHNHSHQAPQSLLQFEPSTHRDNLEVNVPDYEVEEVDDMVRR